MHQRTGNRFKPCLGNLFVITNLEQRSAIPRQRVPVAAATEVSGSGVIAVALGRRHPAATGSLVAVGVADSVMSSVLKEGKIGGRDPQ